MRIRIPRGWEIPEREAASEEVFLDRRRFLAQAGLGALSLALPACAAPSAAARAYTPPAVRAAVKDLYPAKRDGRFTLDRPLTFEGATATLNNFYEFTESKTEVWKSAERLTIHPWTIEVAGLVEKPFTLDVDALVRKLPLEERLYRHRCVEAWAMAVPWTGLPLRRFVEMCRPLASATHLRMVSFHRPSEAPGQLKIWYPWPYYEALTLEEATNELSFLATGVYGHELPPQNGAPIRLVTPWKYGLKSIKSIVRFEFTPGRPATFWAAMSPGTYGFFSNVMPTVPHPNWKQETETMLGTLEKRATLPFNGYGKWVAPLYPDVQLRVT
jgi:sulfoxide reductase catalytic subunit YedY